MTKLPVLLAALAFTTSLLPLATAALSKSAEPLRIAQGERVNLTEYLVPGKTVVFDFTSDFCPPCRAYEQPLKQLHAARSDLVVVKVDINRPNVRGIDWKSPVARQYGIRAVPSFKVYSPDGTLVAEDRIEFDDDDRPTTRHRAGRALVDSWISQLASP